MKPAYFGLGAKEFVNVDDDCIHLSARVEHHCLGVSCPRNKHIFRCDQNGPPARREEGAYPERYVTDE